MTSSVSVKHLLLIDFVKLLSVRTASNTNWHKFFETGIFIYTFHGQWKIILSIFFGWSWHEIVLCHWKWWTTPQTADFRPFLKWNWSVWKSVEGNHRPRFQDWGQVKYDPHSVQSKLLIMSKRQSWGCIVIVSPSQLILCISVFYGQETFIDNPGSRVICWCE